MPQGSAAVVDSFDVTSEAAVAGGVEKSARCVGSRNDPRQQCGRSAERAVRKDRSWPLVARAGGQSERRLSCISRRSLRLESARRGRAAHQHRVDRGPRRLFLCRRLLRREARPHWPHTGAGARIRRRPESRSTPFAPASPRRRSSRARSKPLSRRPADRKSWPRLSLSSPIRRGAWFAPEEVADAVLWLASPGAASINGQAIVVAGGEVMVG